MNLFSSAKQEDIISTSQSFHEDTKRAHGTWGNDPRAKSKINRQSPDFTTPPEGPVPRGEMRFPIKAERGLALLPQGRRELVPIGMENKDIQASEL